MPADLLLPAFALTLAVNAAFVLFAIRSLRAERAGSVARGGRATAGNPSPPRGGIARPGPAGSEVPSPSTPVGTAAAVRDGPPDAEPTASLAIAEMAPAPRDPRPVAELPVSGSDSGSGSATPEPSAPTPVGAVAAARSAAPAPAASAAAATGRAKASSSSAPAARARTGRRRKFSLPPLEDPEKVSRSIETFLTGGDVGPEPSTATAGSASPTAGGDGAVAGPPAPAPAPVVTVAALQLLGGPSRSVLERTVRSTARGTDTVTVDRRGRVRVVLVGTGELAAHAYLRRIRAIVEPILEADDPTSRVVIATATELDGAVGTARRRADRRLGVALRAAAAEAGRPLDPAEADGLESLDEEPPKPRAAGD